MIFLRQARPHRLIPLVVLLFLLSGCATLPAIMPLDPGRKTAVLEGCRRPFLPGRYRLVHALERVMTDGAKGTAVGVLVADPRTRSFRTALMTIEGFVLFDAEAAETLKVNRAVPPFDAPAFAEALAEDIRLAFFLPGEAPAAWGEGEAGALVCRFDRADGRFVEVLTFKGGVMAIRLYGAGQALLKRVKVTLPEGPGLAETLEIRGGWPPYTLRLRLLESEVLGDDSGPTPRATTSRRGTLRPRKWK